MAAKISGISRLLMSPSRKKAIAVEERPHHPRRMISPSAGDAGLPLACDHWPETGALAHGRDVAATVSARRSRKQKQEHPMGCLFALMAGLFPRPGRRPTAA
jgi:hypothetical protein